MHTTHLTRTGFVTADSLQLGAARYQCCLDSGCSARCSSMHKLTLGIGLSTADSLQLSAARLGAASSAVAVVVVVPACTQLISTRIEASTADSLQRCSSTVSVLRKQQWLQWSLRTSMHNSSHTGIKSTADSLQLGAARYRCSAVAVVLVVPACTQLISHGHWLVHCRFTAAVQHGIGAASARQWL
jgi:hypothetical protein